MVRWRFVQNITISFDFNRLPYYTVPQITEFFMKTLPQINLQNVWQPVFDRLLPVFPGKGFYSILFISAKAKLSLASTVI